MARAEQLAVLSPARMRCSIGITVAALSLSVPPRLVGQTGRVPLPELLVEISRERCSGDASEAAAQAVLLAASRYDLHAASSARLEVKARSVQRRVSANDVAQGTEEVATAAVLRGSVPRGREIWLARLRQGTFAVPIGLSSFDGRYEAWAYPPLHADLSYYFLTEDFVEQHNLLFLDASGLVIGFCAKDRDDTYIDGRIVMGQDGRIVSIDWLFRTPRRQEGAGGRALLDSPLPLPRRGIYWRPLPSGDYVEWTDQYLGWSVSGL